MTEFIPARNFTSTTGRQIDLIVLHSMEAGETPRTAERVATWFAGPNAPRASAHWCFDVDSAVRCVHDIDVAWHAPGANHNGLGYEHAGYARQTRAEWLDDYGTAMLEISAAQCKVDCLTYGIPIHFVNADGLLQGDSGITTHWEVTQAFHKSTHWDPGPEFPIGVYLTAVRGAAVLAPSPPNPVPVSSRLVRRGARGDDVRDWQRILIGAKLLPEGADDGVFGVKIEAATKEFQEALHVVPDGVVGPKTREATARLLAWLAAQAPIPDIPPFPGVIKHGSRGNIVSVVQQRLRDRGWNIKVDGIFGFQTDEVVRKFQAEKHLQIDGVVGPKTWVALWVAPVT